MGKRGIAEDLGRVVLEGKVKEAKPGRISSGFRNSEWHCCEEAHSSQATLGHGYLCGDACSNRILLRGKLTAPGVHSWGSAGGKAHRTYPQLLWGSLQRWKKTMMMGNVDLKI